MLIIKPTAQFKKDVRRIEKQNKNMVKLGKMIDQLSQESELPQKNRDHALHGIYIGNRECHIEPNWLLIYKAGAGLLILVRTGSHSDLFR